MKGKSENGAVIVEATFVIPMIIFLVITLMGVANMCAAQAKVQIAINSAAKEISSYSYLYGLTGANEKRAELNSKGESGKASTNEAISGVKSIYSSLSSVSEIADDISNKGVSDAVGTLSDANDGIASGTSSLQNAYNTIKKNPKEYLISMASATGDLAINKGAGIVVGALAKFFAEKHLETPYMSANQYLAHLGVVNGFEGINFSCTRYCDSGLTDEIMVVAIYDIKPIQFFKIDVKYHIVQTGITTAWFGQSAASKEN